MKKHTIIASIIAVVLVICIIILMSPWKADAPDNGRSNKPSGQTITGKLVCLPKKGDGPHTMECAYGVQASDGKYYALKNSNTTDLPTNQEVRVSGTVTPASGDEIYDISGTIDVHSIKPLDE